MKNILVIDTSTARAGFLLLSQQKFYSLENTNVKQHAELLLPMLNQLLEQANITLANLDAIVFGSGPGSFTGIRVTCAIVKAIAYAYDLPLYPVSSLQALAYSATCAEEAKNTPVLAMLDARMQEVYWEYSVLMHSNGAFVGNVADIHIPKVDNLIICGPDLDNFLKTLPSSLKNLPYVYKNVYPEVRSMLSLVQTGYIRPVSASVASPQYVRNKVVRGVTNG